MESFRHKPQHLWQRFPPVGPGVTTIPHPVFMRNVVLPHFYVHQGIAFMQKIIVTAVDIPANRLLLFFGHVPAPLIR